MRWLIATLPLAVACGSPGKVTVTTYGEDFIEQGIPAEELADGWGITFSKFLVVIGELKIAASDGTIGAEMPVARVFDVTKPGPTQVITFDSVEDRDFDQMSYAIAPSTTASSGNVEQPDVERMTSNGWSVYVEGTATKGADTKTFAWGLDTNTHYQGCGPADGERGITVPSGGAVNVDLTIHGDHLVFDDLQSPDAKMRFEAFAAADADTDGVVTLEELGGVDLASLPAESYGTGSVPSVTNLRQFVTALVRTLGHFQGEGECEPHVR